MNPQNNNKLRFRDYWIGAKEHKKFRRLYFEMDKVYVIKAPNERIKLYLTVEIVCAFLFLSAFFNQSVIISGFIWGVILSSLCGGITATFVAIVIITIRLWSIDNKLKNLSINEILNINRDNYFINYSDISSIEFHHQQKTLFRNEWELHIVSAQGTHILIISDEYFDEIEGKIEKIKSQNRDIYEG